MVSEKDKGQSEAINKGFKKATGEIINWICSDDKLAPGALVTVAGLFSSSSEDTGVIYGNIDYINSHSAIQKNIFDDVKNRVRTKIDFFKGMAFAQPAAFFKKSLLERVGYLDTDLHFGMDYDLYARLAMVSDFMHTRELIAFYRLHRASKTINQKRDFSHDWLQVCGRIFITLFETEFNDLINELQQEGIDYKLDFPVYNFSFDRASIKDVSVQEMNKEFLQLLFDYQLEFRKYSDAYLLLKYIKKAVPDLLVSEKYLKKHFNLFKWLGIPVYSLMMKVRRK